MVTPKTPVAEQFPRDTAGHVMTVLHDDGLYRHLRFANPTRSSYWYEIVTWPGSLAVRGDMGGGYVFRRQNDMLEFFRARSGWNANTINPDYWAEKLPGGRDSVREYSEDVLAALVEEHLSGYEKRYPDLAAEYEQAKAEYRASFALPRDRQEPTAPTEPDEARELYTGAKAQGETSHESGARALLADLERIGVVSDTWEWNLAGWTYEFLWFCHAIQWGIAQYDKARVPEPVGPGSPDGGGK